MLGGMLWVLHSGAAWRDLPERFGPWQSVYDRFNRYREQGVWGAVLRRLQAQAELGHSQWDLDGTVVRAARPAAGRKKIPCPPASRLTTRWGGPEAAGGPRPTSAATPWATRRGSS